MSSSQNTRKSRQLLRRKSPQSWTSGGRSPLERQKSSSQRTSNKEEISQMKMTGKMIMNLSTRALFKTGSKRRQQRRIQPARNSSSTPIRLSKKMNMKARLLEVIILIPSQGRSMASIMKTKAMFYQDRTAEARFTKMISTAKSILTIIPLLMPLIQVQSVDKLTTKIICTRISLSSSKENTILHSTLVWLVANSNRGKSIPSREILDSTTEEAPSFK